MANSISDHSRVKLFIAEMSTPITDYDSGNTKSAEDVFLEEFQHGLGIISGCSNCFYPLRYIVHCHQNVSV